MSDSTNITAPTEYSGGKTIRVEFTEDYRCFKKGKVFEIPTQCCIVGDNGSGKTTLLSTILYHAGKKVDTTEDKKAEVTGYDFAYTYSFTTATDKKKALPMSSGQHQILSLSKVLREATYTENSLTILDEPESNIDFRHRLALCARIRCMVEDPALKRDIIVCSHSPDIMRLFPFVFIIPLGKVMSTEEYIFSKEMESLTGVAGDIEIDDADAHSKTFSAEELTEARLKEAAARINSQTAIVEAAMRAHYAIEERKAKNKIEDLEKSSINEIRVPDYKGPMSEQYVDDVRPNK